MAVIHELGPADPVKEPDHVLVVKHDDDRFEVSGTAGAGKPDAHYLTPAPFADKEDAMICAVTFADEHGLPTVYVKGFRVETAA
jgi:hypothetical protein